MSYLGYRVIINEITIPDRMMIRESYGTTPNERQVYSWTDANQIAHYDVVDTPKMSIQFSLRRRTLEEQEALIDAFSSFQNITVTYWDDKSCSYKEGLFKMDPPQFVNYIDHDEMWYTATQIHLTEY